ncbi:hypothetical protein P43SY_007586 [Pythium insidiosum]|uniref:valine--tRNA ligase n=1 Tax=Pythium insidiosum TaxID=114742 RepID=A0AAD5MD14_PYTIN|nr:hypothetical protein P43SY_007586 [Pythium insidiosum]
MRALFLRRCRASAGSIESRAQPLLRSIASSAGSSARALQLPVEIRRRVKDEPLAPAFDPASVEQGWQDFWQAVLRDRRQCRGGNGKQFSMLLPPPNVTGALHIGHALTITIQDALARWHLMRGFDVQWIPGLDHAGIATQSVVERKLMKDEGKTRHDLGRDAFVERVWQWNEQYGGRILHQIDQLGAIVDKDASFFTLDEKRPETIFGDVAVAIHPDDARFAHVHGMHVVHPFSGQQLPIVLDDALVNMELGTGVVKVTPAHDPKDYECGQRHRLPEPIVIDEDGILCGDIDPRFIGMDRFDARSAVIEELIKKDLYVEKWFVDCSSMAERAVKNVRNGQLLIEPKTHEHMWFYFLDNIRDWCVSRQLWWGHRIPAYQIRRPGQVSNKDEDWVVARSLEEARRKAVERFGSEAQNYEIEQDVDVLDTWFSSGLLPISVFDWPNNDPCAAAQYPLSVMETGSDILFFWVARMAMLCEEFSGEIPFKRVLLHPMVRDKSGRKMSKSLGNVIDPNHVIHGITLDALLSGVKVRLLWPDRYGSSVPDKHHMLLRHIYNKINMDVQRVVSHRQFCNKIWNAVRYALPLLETDKSNTLVVDGEMSLADRWILSRLANVVQEMNQGLESNHLAVSVSAFHRFFVQDLCDVYIEFSKPILYGNRVDVDEFGSLEGLQRRQHAARATLYNCLDLSMRLLHPFSPFVTEELWETIVAVVCSPNSEDSVLAQALRDIEVQCRSSVQLIVTDDVDSYSTGGPALSQPVSSSCKVLLPMPSDPETPHRVKNEIMRLQKRITKMEATAQSLIQRISSAGYKEKVPEAIQLQDSSRVTQLETDIQAAKDSIYVLQALDAQY